MLTADQIWHRVKHHIPAPKRRQGQVVFRRLIREFFTYRGGRARHPITQRIQKDIQIGERWVFTGGRWRKRVRFLGSRSVGRPSGGATTYLVAMLGFYWALWTDTPTSIHHATYQCEPTKWEHFLFEVLGWVGVSDHRRHAVKHSKSKPK